MSRRLSQPNHTNSNSKINQLNHRNRRVNQPKIINRKELQRRFRRQKALSSRVSQKTKGKKQKDLLVDGKLNEKIETFEIIQ